MKNPDMCRIIAIESPCQQAADTVELDHDQRTRRRIVYATDDGRSILLDMARPVRLQDGDGLRLNDGTLVRVKAMGEPLIEITAPDIAALVRIAWHLGNRHLPTQLLCGEEGASLRIRRDHVIAAMVEGLGGRCRSIMAAFEPEGGAYAGVGHSHLGQNTPDGDAHHTHHHGDSHHHGHGAHSHG